MDQLPGFEEIDQYRNVTGVKGQATLAECIDRTIDDGVAHFAAGTTVKASNPGGRAVTGVVVGPGQYPNTTAVEWVGPHFYDGDRHYIGNFTTVEAV